MQNKFKFIDKGKLFQFFACVIGTTTTISDGMLYGWSAPVGPFLLSDESPIESTESNIQWLETIYMIGLFTGLPISVLLQNWIGRKKSMLFSAVISLIVWIIIEFATKIEHLLVARFLAGIATDINFSASPVYIAEVADKKIRGFLSSILFTELTLGITLIYVIVPYVSYEASSKIGILVILPEILLFPFMPDSPYYLLYKDKEKKARKALKALRQKEDIEEEIIEISKEFLGQTRGKLSLCYLIKTKNIRKAIMIIFFLNCFQHSIGHSAIMMNMHLILSAANSKSINISLVAILFPSVMLLACLFSPLYIDRFGRKTLLIISGMFTGLCLLVISTYFALQHHKFNVSDVTYLPCVFIMIYALAYRSGIGVIPTGLAAELFPTNLRVLGLIVANGVYKISAIIAVECFFLLSDAYGMYAPFLCFTMWNIILILFVIFYIPETKGKTLEEIQKILES